MLQDFRTRTTPDTGAARLAALRRRWPRPASMPFSCHAPMPTRARTCAARPAAGLADRLHRLGGPRRRTAERAAVFVDGRYRLQVQGQVDTGGFEMRRCPRTSPTTGWSGVARRRPARVRPLAPHRTRGRGTLRGARLPSGRPRAGLEPLDRAWPDQPAAPARPIGRIRWSWPGGARPKSGASRPRARRQ